MVLHVPLQELILFLTDGYADDPEHELKELLADHGKRIKCLTCVALGQHADISMLKKIGAKFQDQNIHFEVREPDSQESLIAAFEEAAVGSAIHCK